VLGNVPIVVLGIALLSRDGDNRMPHHDEQVYEGDHVTFIVRTEAVREAIDYCTG
jgi:Trk K+ transport system NAD-binding subunit